MSTVFDVLSRFCLCKGFPVVAQRTAKDARGNTVGTSAEWRSRDDVTVTLYLRSTQCHVLLQTYTRPVTIRDNFKHSLNKTSKLGPA